MSWQEHGDAAYLDDVDLDRREHEADRRADATWEPPRRASWTSPEAARRWAALLDETAVGPRRPPAVCPDCGWGTDTAEHQYGCSFGDLS